MNNSKPTQPVSCLATDEKILLLLNVLQKVSSIPEYSEDSRNLVDKVVGKISNLLDEI